MTIRTIYHPLFIEASWIFMKKYIVYYTLSQTNYNPDYNNDYNYNCHGKYDYNYDCNYNYNYDYNHYLVWPMLYWNNYTFYLNKQYYYLSIKRINFLSTLKSFNRSV